MAPELSTRVSHERWSVYSECDEKRASRRTANFSQAPERREGEFERLRYNVYQAIQREHKQN